MQVDLLHVVVISSEGKKIAGYQANNHLSLSCKKKIPNRTFLSYSHLGWFPPRSVPRMALFGSRILSLRGCLGGMKRFKCKYMYTKKRLS